MTSFLSRRLVDHFADWILVGGRRVGVHFVCPSCPQIEGATTIGVLFANPPDGGPPQPGDPNILGNNEGRRWQRSGDTIETMSLSPSIDCSKCGHWHGFVTSGEAK